MSDNNFVNIYFLSMRWWKLLGVLEMTMNGRPCRKTEYIYLKPSEAHNSI